MATKLTTEEVDEKILGRSIIRISNYINYNTKIQWKCLKETCGYIWLATPGNIFHGKGCPKCAGQVAFTNKEVDNLLIEKNIIRKEDYININTKILFECLICNYQWKTVPNNILNYNTHCPRCSNRAPLTNEIIDKRINGRNIERIGNAGKALDKIMWRCTKRGCGYKWMAQTHSVINNNTGCPKCAGYVPITNEQADKRIKGRNIIRLENMRGVNKKIKWKCCNLECGHEWTAEPCQVFGSNRRGSGCPVCNLRSRSTQKYIFEYLITLMERVNISYDKKRIYYDNKKFFIPDIFIKPNIIIEYHGKQHYMPIKFFGGEETFKKQQLRDANLRKYCQGHNFPLLEIPYTMKETERKIVIKEFLEKNCKELLIRQ